MAEDYHKKLNIPGTEEEFWNTLFNTHNLEHATNIDVKDVLHPRPQDFRIHVKGQNIEGKIDHVDIPDTNSTTLIFEWRVADQDEEDKWPPGQYATTKIITADVSGETYVEFWITNIPGVGRSVQYNFAVDLWENQIIRNIGKYLSTHPTLEKAIE